MHVCVWGGDKWHNQGKITFGLTHMVLHGMLHIKVAKTSFDDTPLSRKAKSSH